MVPEVSASPGEAAMPPDGDTPTRTWIPGWTNDGPPGVWTTPRPPWMRVRPARRSIADFCADVIRAPPGGFGGRRLERLPIYRFAITSRNRVVE
jgi:hypothetical protein